MDLNGLGEISYICQSVKAPCISSPNITLPSHYFRSRSPHRCTCNEATPTDCRTHLCFTEKYTPFVKFIIYYSFGTWVVYFPYPQSLHIDDVMSLFFTVFCAHSVVLYNELAWWLARYFFPRVKNSILPLENIIFILASPCNILYVFNTCEWSF